jgi:glycosyltransferase involved in cell wall biosynthesis
MFLLRLCPHLRARGHDIEVVTTQERGEWFERMAAHVPTVHVDVDGHFRRCRRPLRVGRFLGQASHDMVFLNGDLLAQQSLTMLPDRVVAAPVIHSDRETTYRLAAANSEAWNLVVAVGPKLAQTAAARLPHRPVVEIMPGVDPPGPSAFAQRSVMTGDELRVLFVGRIVQGTKNVMLLPEVVRQCREEGLNVRLTVAGDGEDRAALAERVRGLGVTEHMDLIGAVPPEEVYPLLLDHHALMLPSFYEGLPLVLAEAQACGCVPVASRLEGVTTAVVEDGRTGWLVDVGDGEGFAEALRQLYRDPERWAAMSAAGHAEAVTHFSVDRMTDDYARLIREALAGKYPLPRSRRGRLPVNPRMYWRECLPPQVRALGRRVLGRS